MTDDVTDDYLRALEEARSDEAKSRREASDIMSDLNIAAEANDPGTAVGM